MFRDYGDDMMRASGIGEFATNWAVGGNSTDPGHLYGGSQSDCEARLGVSAAHAVGGGR